MAHSQNWGKNLCVALALGALAATAATATPVVSLSPTPAVTTVGGSLALDVVITGVSDLYAYNYTIDFNPAVVQMLGETEGSFLSNAATTSYIAGSIDNVAGTYTFTGNALNGAAKGVTGSGVLEHLTFSVLTAAPATFTFASADTGFYDSNFATITVTANALTVMAAVPEPATYALFGLGLAGLVAWRRRAAPAVRQGANA